MHFQTQTEQVVDSSTNCNQASFGHTNQSADSLGAKGFPTERAAQFASGWDLPTHFQSQTEQVVDSSTNCNQASFGHTNQSADSLGAKGFPTERAAQFASGWDLPTHFQSQTEQVVDSSTNCNQVSLGTRTSQLILVEPKGFQPNELPNLRRDATCQRIFRHKLSKW